MKYEPYREDDDRFEETAGSLAGRLHTDPENGHAQFRPLPTEEQLSAFYNGPYVRPRKEMDPKAEYTPAVVEVARALVNYLTTVGGLSPDFTTHDVGCAYGALTYAFQAIGIRATGNEANRSEVEAGNAHCRGALSSKPLAECLAELGYPIDLFTALHVLEHLPDPRAALETMARHLSPSGLIYICVPNGHSLQAMLGGRRMDPCYNFPGHLQYFTPKSLIEMILSVGLRPVSLNTRALPHMEGGRPALERALGIPDALMVDGPSWTAACCANLLGYELFVLAARPENTTAQREPEILRRAETAYRAFVHRSPFEHGVGDGPAATVSG